METRKTGSGTKKTGSGFFSQKLELDRRAGVGLDALSFSCGPADFPKSSKFGSLGPFRGSQSVF